MLAAVEHQAQRVVPAAPRRQPVGEQQPAGRELQRKLLLHLAGDRELRRLADLDHAAWQVPVLLVAQPAQQHPPVPVADQELADRPLARQERVEQCPEGLRLAERGVAGETREDDVLRGVGAVIHTGGHAADALTGSRPGSRREATPDDRRRPGPRRAAARDHPDQRRERPVRQQPHGPSGVSRAALAGVERPREIAAGRAGGGDLDIADGAPVVLDDERRHEPSGIVGGTPLLDQNPGRQDWELRGCPASGRSPRHARRPRPRCRPRARAAG